MIENLDYVVRSDILPSQLKLPIDNWRETPNTQIDELAKSIASVGLHYPPIVAKNTKGDYIVIDGNRRTYACKLLEKGYETEINDIPVILKLPSSWCIHLTTKTYEEIGEDNVAKIRYHTTEMHVHFSTKSIYSQLQEDIRKYALERSLTLQSIYNNKTLKEEFMNYMSKKYQLDKMRINDYLKVEKDNIRTKPEIKEALYNQDIGSSLAERINVGIPKEQIPDVLKIIKKYKELGFNETPIVNRLGSAKAEAREQNITVAMALDKRMKNATKTIKLFIELSPEDHIKLELIRKQKQTTFTQMFAPIIKKFYNLK